MTQGNERLKILLICSKDIPEVVEIPDDLEVMQSLVGGFIDIYEPFDDDVIIVCNEDGKRKELPLNRRIYDEDGRHLDTIRGDFFLCRCPVESESFHSLTDEEIEKYEKMFWEPELSYYVEEINAGKKKNGYDKGWER